MVDVLSANQRRRCMSRVASSNTNIELQARRMLHRDGFRFRVNRRDLPGKPDIVLPKYKHVVFVHGCFWHGHDCKSDKLPTTNTEFWEAKILSNKKRDHRVIGELEAAGWTVSIVWGCGVAEGISSVEAFLREKL